MVLVYATSTDYEAWTSTTPPANISPILRAASLAVTEATELCFYDTDSTGLPTDTSVLKAFNDATCCQAAALVAINYDPTTGGTITTSVKQSKGIGSAHITYAQADADAAATAKARAITGLVPDAQRILRNAGLYRTAPWVVG